MIRRLAGTVIVVALVAALGLPAPAGEDAAEAKLRGQLKTTTVNLSVDGQTLAEVMKLLRVQTGFNLLFDPRVESDFAENPVPALLVKDLPLEKVLDMLADAAGEDATWHVKGNVIILTARQLLPLRLENRIYPVAALVAGRTEFVPPPHGLVGSGLEPESVERYYPYGSADELIELIRGGVEPRYWEETEGVDVATMGEEHLLVRAAPRVHAALDHFLARLEDMTPDAVQVEVYAIAPTMVPPGTDVGPLRDEVAAAILAQYRSGPALTLAVRKQMQSVAFTGAREAYVRGHEAYVAGANALLDPEVANVDVGMAARVRALPSPQGNRLLLELDVAVAEPTSRRTHQSASGEELALPGRRIVRRDGVLLLTPGRWHWSEGRAGGKDPARWGFLVRATPVDAEVGAQRRSFPIPSPQPHAGHRVLADRAVAGVRWVEASLDQVAVTVSALSGLNVYITPVVRAEVYEEVVIDLELGETSLATVLDLVTEPYELSWHLDGNLITIDQKRRELDGLQLRYFDVRDLCVRVTPAQVDPVPDYPWVERPAEPAPIYEAERLVDLIRRTIGNEEHWEDPASIEVRNHIVIARNTSSVLDAVETLLDGLRASRELIVTTVDLFEVDDDVWRDLLGGRLGARPFLDAATAVALDRAVAAGAVAWLSRERIVSIEGSGTPRASGEEIPYVADYDIHHRSGSDAAAPVRRVQTVHSGTRTHARSTLGYPADRVSLELTLDRTILTSMGEASTPHGTIDLPRLDVWSVSTGLRIPIGRTALVSAGRSDGTWRLLLATPRRVPLEER